MAKGKVELTVTIDGVPLAVITGDKVKFLATEMWPREFRFIALLEQQVKDYLHQLRDVLMKPGQS